MLPKVRIPSVRLYQIGAAMLTQNDGIVSPTISFVSPDGEIVEVWSLGQLAQQYGLDRRALWAVAKGRRLSHLGWTLVGTERRRRSKYKLVNAQTGEVAEFSSIAEWAEAQGLKAGRIRKLINNQIKSVAGWRQEGTTMGFLGLGRTKQTPFTIYSITGQTVVVESVSAFCKEHGLNRQGVYSLLSGKLKTYNGWSISPNITESIIKMIGPDGQTDTIQGNAKAFANKHGLDSANLYRLLRGDCKSVQGWRVSER